MAPDGTPIIVEIDESKFGKRKDNRGHQVEGVWIVGEVERTEERKLFLTTVPDRSAETLLAVIKKFLRSGSIIHTDCWAAYNRLAEQEDYELVHRTVNHSEGFIAPDGTHTNTIEGEHSLAFLH